MSTRNTIYTIGHSTKSFEDFVTMLLSFNVKLLIDIRSYPGSRWFPHFNKERMRIELAKHQIEYIHSKDLGGRREVESQSDKLKNMQRSADKNHMQAMITKLRWKSWKNQIAKKLRLTCVPKRIGVSDIVRWCHKVKLKAIGM